jgi:uncharacterized protein YcfL
MRKLFLALAIGLLVVGCDSQTVLGPNDWYSTTNDSGQHIDSIKKADLRTWLSEHKKMKIVSLTAAATAARKVRPSTSLSRRSNSPNL